MYAANGRERLSWKSPQPTVRCGRSPTRRWPAFPGRATVFCWTQPPWDLVSALAVMPWWSRCLTGCPKTRQGRVM